MMMMMPLTASTAKLRTTSFDVVACDALADRYMVSSYIGPRKPFVRSSEAAGKKLSLKAGTLTSPSESFGSPPPRESNFPCQVNLDFTRHSFQYR